MVLSTKTLQHNNIDVQAKEGSQVMFHEIVIKHEQKVFKQINNRMSAVTLCVAFSSI